MVKLVCERKVKEGTISNYYRLSGNYEVLQYLFNKLDQIGYEPKWNWNDDTRAYDVVLYGKKFLDFTEEIEDEFNDLAVLVKDLIKEYQELKKKEAKITVFYDDESEEEGEKEDVQEDTE